MVRGGIYGVPVTRSRLRILDLDGIPSCNGGSCCTTRKRNRLWAVAGVIGDGKRSIARPDDGWTKDDPESATCSGGDHRTAVVGLAKVAGRGYVADGERNRAGIS